jgi:hypothetical protein
MAEMGRRQRENIPDLVPYVQKTEVLDDSTVEGSHTDDAASTQTLVQNLENAQASGEQAENAAQGSLADKADIAQAVIESMGSVDAAIENLSLAEIKQESKVDEASMNNEGEGNLGTLEQLLIDAASEKVLSVIND